jgi:hypothetical protein
MDGLGVVQADRLISLATRTGRASRDSRVRALVACAIARRRAARLPEVGAAERRRLLCEATGYARAVLRLERGVA